MKGCEPSLILKVRVFGTRKWSITLIVLCSPLLTLSDEKKKPVGVQIFVTSDVK